MPAGTAAMTWPVKPSALSLSPSAPKSAGTSRTFGIPLAGTSIRQEITESLPVCVPQMHPSQDSGVTGRSADRYREAKSGAREHHGRSPQAAGRPPNAPPVVPT